MPVQACSLGRQPQHDGAFARRCREKVAVVFLFVVPAVPGESICQLHASGKEL